MGDCNITSLPYHNNAESREKYCKYSYSSWCSTCEKTSPRRRSKSETNHECCKKKCREMKSLSSKKYDKCLEYENMELEYDCNKGWHESKFDYCRIRPNLVELPTSYIANNCQISPNMPVSKNEGLNCLKPPKSYECCLTKNSIDLEPTIEDINTMESSHKKLTTEINEGKIASHSLESSSIMISSYLKSNNGFHHSAAQKAKILSDNQQIENVTCFANGHHHLSSSNNNNNNNCRELPQLVEFRGHDLNSKMPLCYDTNTYFNRPIDREKYCNEVDYLREKLKLLRNTSYINPINTDLNVVNLHDNGDNNGLQESIITNTMEIKPKIIIKKPSLSSIELLKGARSKIALKTRKFNNSSKTKKLNKAKTGTVPNNPLSSGSESDSIEDSDSFEENSEDISSSEPISTDESCKESINVPEISNTELAALWPIRPSLFPNTPPYIQFRSHELDSPYKLPSGRKFFKWKLSTITPIIVRKTLSNSGFALVRKSNQWLGTWGKHMKSPLFKTLKDNQKLNHFPGTFQLGRKDRLWKNFYKMISKYGLKEFGFIPHTFVLPQELKLLKNSWDFKNNGDKEMWIIKPPASARGVGIKVINKWTQLPKKTSLVCQKYIHNPYLINGSKFDLRLYVLVTSFHPLRIYLYPEGLARFASAKYTGDIKDLKDRYMHLTNYSINKLSSQYTANEDANACQGHKWTLTKLMEYMHLEGVDTKTLWKNLQQLVIKTIISCEPLITPLCEENMNSYYNCYELFGVDVLLDEHLKPWLLEVNISPSLHSASPLDAFVKGPLVQTLFDLAQFHFPLRLSQNVKNGPQCLDSRIYTRNLSKKERNKHVKYVQFQTREDYLPDILKELTGDDVRHLLRAEDEYVVKGKFQRIFPTVNSHKYLDFMESRYYNRLFDAWETKYSARREDGISLLQRLCAQKVHLKVGSATTLINKSGANMTQNGLIQITDLQPTIEAEANPEKLETEKLLEANIKEFATTLSEEIRV